MSRRALLARVFGVGLLLATGAHVDEARGQGAFRVTHAVDRTGPSHVELSGTVVNEGPADAIDVYVTAEALDQTGRRVAQGISWVGAVSRNSSTRFTAKVPVVRGVARYRVAVSSFRYVSIQQAP